MHPNDVDPLLESLLALARTYGITATEETLTAGLPLVDHRLTPSLLPRAAERANLTTRIVNKSLDEMTNDHLLPAILLTEGNEALVLLDWSHDKGVAEVILPELGHAKSTISRYELKKIYSGHAIMARPIFQMDSNLKSSRVRNQKGHWFWSVIRENRAVYRDVLFAALFINLFALAVPIFTMNVYDRVVPNHAIETLWMLAAGVGLVLVADAVLKTIRSYFLDLASRRVDVRLSAVIMERVLGLRLEAKPNSVGSFASNLRSFESVRDFITSASINTLIDLPFSIIFLLVIAWIAPPVVIPVVVAIVLVVIYALITQSRLRRLTETMHVASAMRNSTLVESLVGLETLKSMGAEGRMQRKWESTSAYLARIGIQLRKLSTSSISFTQWAQQTCAVAVIVYGVYLITAAELSMGGLIAVNMLASRALAPFAQMAGLILQYHNAATALDSLEEIMSKPVERSEDRQLLTRDHLKGDLVFSNVSFSYPESEVGALRDASLSVSQGETVVVLGRVGSGKSTLLKMAMGLYTPSEGSVTIDGIDLRQLDPADLRTRVGYVPQEAVLFRGTLRENLMLAQLHVTDADLMQAAEMAGIDEFIKRHPKGLDMEVGERGEALSGGQRKGVVLARALVHKPNVMFMDEPTGSMDHSTESTVVKNLAEYRKGRTLCLITHRTSLLDLADRIVVVDNGKVVANGPRDNVIEALRQGKVGRAS